jgi:nitroimidazol reductase NimA-like FMN-containing flavoprotein (pyridoxamine 5'-phosphate oxidase superfamily)
MSAESSPHTPTPTFTPPASDRTKVRRLPERGRYDRGTIDAILDSALIGHVGYVIDGQPFVTPTSVWRQGDRLYWHGSSASRMLRATSDDVPVCVTVTLLDALVLARSGFDHSIDYRCVMILGTARAVEDPDEQLESLRSFMERLYPGRWDQLRPVTRQELKATTVLWTTISEASAKLRVDGPHDEPGDETWPAWGGLIPVETRLARPEPDGFVPEAMPAPSVSSLIFPAQDLPAG